MKNLFVLKENRTYGSNSFNQSEHPFLKKEIQTCRLND
ncbi:MAG: hypothetical protein HSCHL_0197 [Hydrogenibacillus schlegelii]|uniref:Uncharacterized protein n=1 Tax=Hydrogenibacillus schlegelii TaxID=1484 RepID=A0A2T5GEJ5_HYDSH|nr:MAG: hypothetical protein HSCHL_0197 [Hydrogenibacillus schlegelii]